MKKILFFSLFVVALFFIVGCEEGLTPEEEELFGDQALAGQAIEPGDCRQRPVYSCEELLDGSVRARIRSDTAEIGPIDDYCSANNVYDYRCTDIEGVLYVQQCVVQCQLELGESCVEGACVGATVPVEPPTIADECAINDDCPDVIERSCNADGDACSSSTSYICQEGSCVSRGGGGGCQYCANGCSGGYCVEAEEPSGCDSLLEGETNSGVIDGIAYEITTSNFVYEDYEGGVRSVDFEVNGELFTLLEGETHTLNDGNTFTLSNIYYEDYEGGVHRADFCLNVVTVIPVEPVLLSCGEIVADEEEFVLGARHLKYKGADRSTQSNPMAKYKDFATGETFNREITFEDGVGRFNMKIDGITYNFVSASDTSIDDWDIQYECLECSAWPSCDVISTLHEGESMSFTFGGETYEVTNEAMTSEPRVRFGVNDEETLNTLAGVVTQFGDGSRIMPFNILYQNVAGGVHQATFCFRVGTSSSSGSVGGGGGPRTVFGGCPRGSTGSRCIDASNLQCTGSEEFGDQVIDCGAVTCVAGDIYDSCT